MSNRKLKSIIVEDEMLSADLLKGIILEYSPDVDVIEVVRDIPDAIESISRVKPDIVFLDIELNGKNSFEILDHFPSFTFKIIVTSGHEQYALQAFQHRVTDYLLKPYSIDQLIKSIEKVKRLMPFDLSNAFYFGCIALPGSDGVELFQFDDIIRIEADGMYSHVYLSNHSKMVVSRPMGTLKKNLSETIFIRVHHSHLINIHYLTRFIKGENGALELKDGSIIPVSKRRKKEVLQRIKSL
jgi:two-component system, LytTR family, response regulator